MVRNVMFYMVFGHSFARRQISRAHPDPSQLSNEKSKALVRDKPEDPDSRLSDMRMLNIFKLLVTKWRTSAKFSPML